MKYDNDQCEECGKELLIKKMVIETLKRKNELLKRMLHETLKYGFKRNRDNVQLLRHIRDLETEIRRRSINE